MTAALNLRFDDTVVNTKIAVQDALRAIDGDVDDICRAVNTLDHIVASAGDKKIDPETISYMTDMLFRHAKELKQHYNEQWDQVSLT